MKLALNTTIQYGETKITEAVLEDFRKKWMGQVRLNPGVGRDRFPDLILLHALLYEYTPFLITGDGFVDLATTFKMFPYSIDGEPNFTAFALRLMPSRGRLASVELTAHDPHDVNILTMNRSRIIADLGHGTLHLEIYFDVVDIPPELGPPASFREDVDIST